jgi:glycosyltransferase involved in cell wall biosynthesis
MNPLVSVCVPNLNMRPFLPQRFETIFNQTYNDLEIFVFDSFSDDGAWEYLTGLAEKEPRMRLKQGPREGPYAAWNRCIQETSGDYVYIATSDDTMAPDCLQKLVAALDRHPDCDLAHCPLRIIDSSGNAHHPPRWPDDTVFAESLVADIADKPHVRKAPYDGLLHLTGKHVLLSITQLLIRRSLFEKIGLFPSTWGSISDFNWEMKAGLVANMVHVPDTWASWRVHSNQLTAPSNNFQSAERDKKIQSMIEDAMTACSRHLPLPVRSHAWFEDTKFLREYYGYLGHGRSVGARRLHQAKRTFTGPGIIRTELLRKLTARSKWPDYAPKKIRRWLEQKGFEPIVPC